MKTLNGFETFTVQHGSEIITAVFGTSHETEGMPLLKGHRVSGCHGDLHPELHRGLEQAWSLKQ